MANIKIYQSCSSNIAPVLIISDVLIFQISDLTDVGQGHKMQFRNDAVWYQISKSINVVRCIFAPTVSDILILNFFNLQNLRQGHEVQFWQLRHSMANIKIYKSRSMCGSSSRFRDFFVANLWPSKRRSRSRSTIFAITLAIPWQMSKFANFLHFLFSLRCDLCEWV